MKIDDRIWDAKTGKAINCPQHEVDELMDAIKAAKQGDATAINELRLQESLQPTENDSNHQILSN